MTPRRADRPPDDDEPQLSDDDIRWIHQQRKLDAHAEWLRGQVRVLWPWVVSVDGAGRKRTIVSGKYKYVQDITKD